MFPVFRNFRVWEAISFAMQELGHDRTAIQCKNRIQVCGIRERQIHFASNKKR